MDPNPIPPSLFMSFAGVPLTFPTPTIAEVENHIVPAANPSPSAPPALLHPPYADMICTAIADLKEKDGSSERAIARYIEKAYAGLPVTHSALLTHNLKRLKDSGHLVMVKKSYKLFRSDDATAATSATVNASAPSQSEPQSIPPTRGRGRPAKNKTQPHVAPQIPQSQQGLFQNEQSQFQAQPHQSQNQYADPILVALGLVDEPAIVQKRDPGWPRKDSDLVDVTGQVGSVSIGRKRGRPPGSKGKKAGRPPKPKSVSSISNGLKRRPGRPRKVQLPVFPSAPATMQDIAPPNDAAATNQDPNVQTMPAPSVPTLSNTNLPRRRGRPRKYPVGLPYIGGYMRPRSSTGRPVGRPRKNHVLVANASNGELSRKLEQFQSKVREAVDILKPNFSDESSVAAIKALKDLELLATVDLNAPLKDDTTQQPPVPLAQAQLQLDSYPNLQ